jgi:uncharacterized protein
MQSESAEGRGRMSCRPIGWGLRRAALALLGAFTLVAGLAAQLPAPRGAVSDFANVLSDEQERTLALLSQAIEAETTAEIAVATVPSLDGMEVEDYATRLFAQWGIGQAATDNGVLILVAPTERAMRIEVGYGLEGVLPDGLAGQIIRETFIPRFREDDYATGILEGTTRVAEIVRRNETLTAEQRAALEASSDADGNIPIEWVLVPFFGIFISIGFGMFGTGVGARAFFPIVFGSLFGGIPLLLSVAMAPGIGARILIAVAFTAVIIGVLIGRKPATRASMRAGSGKAKSNGWVWGAESSGGRGGSGSGWSSGSSGGSSGGFGGGSSGGGGASGRW